MASLSDAFLARLEPAAREQLAARASLEHELAACVAAANAAWPDVAFEPAAFATQLARKLPLDLEPTPLVERAHVSDLCLAWMCARGDAIALAAFEDRVFSELDAALRSMEIERWLVDEVKQIVRVELFVAAPDRVPLIETYAGRGSLRGWLRSIAVRTAMKLLHKHKRVTAVSDDDELAQLPATDAGPELAHFRRRYGAAFKAAFVEALAALDSRERNLLRQHFLDQLDLDELGRLYAAHRATVARWLARARMRLLEGTRARLRERLGISDAELDSVLRLVRSELYLSLHRLLAQ
jgi:RNA polymerase sigma-70 factor, ECF subfamily